MGHAHGISIQYLIAGIVLQTIQTLFTAFAWVAILRYAYPESKVARLQLLACYAAVGRAERVPAGEPRHADAAA